MKLTKLLLTGAFAAVGFSLQAAEQPTVAPAAAAQPVESPIDAQLKPLVAKIRTKLTSGERTEAALAPELKEFDSLLAAHQGEKSEDMAKVAFLRATLFVQVFENYDKGAEYLKQVQQDYPGTQAAQAATDLLERLAAQKESIAMQKSLQPGTTFPNFEEKDLNGKPLSIAQYKGKVVLVDFWATWCGPCVHELPNVIAAYDKYHAKGFEIVGISLDESQDKLKSFIADKKMTWQQYFDGQGWNSKLGRKYGVNAIPATYLLDKDGKIVAKDLRGPALDAKLAELLKD